MILVVAAYFPDSYGGAERQASILAQALSRKGVDVTIVAPSISPEAPDIEETEFGRIERFKVSAYPNRGGRYLSSFIAWTLWFRRRYAPQAKRGVPIYVFHARLHALGPALAAAKGNAPLLIKLGGGGEASDFAALRVKKFLYGHWVQSFLLQRTDFFVANGRQVESDLHALGVHPSKIASFPNGVALPPKAHFNASLEQRSGTRFVFSGRMVADKRVEVLYEAALALSGKVAAVQLVFLGDGPEQGRLSSLPRHNLKGVEFEFPGFVEDVYPSLQAADFFLSASKREGQSNALLEAMSAGVIPIVYNASGVAEVIDHGKNGFIVMESSSEAFSEVMKMALDMPQSRRREMAFAARRFAESHIGIDKVADQTLETLTAASMRRKGTL